MNAYEKKEIDRKNESSAISLIIFFFSSSHYKFVLHIILLIEFKDRSPGPRLRNLRLRVD